MPALIINFFYEKWEIVVNVSEEAMGILEHSQMK